MEIFIVMNRGKKIFEEDRRGAIIITITIANNNNNKETASQCKRIIYISM
jgi:hypothetical protein